MFTDQAAENAAKQFNATSENQSDQFFANLKTQTSQFNTSQANAMSQFNAGEENAVKKFNTEIANQRDQFNAQNGLVIAQSNAVWRREIATAATAAVNRANEINAAAVLDNADPAAGYESFGDYSVPVEDQLFGGWVPGSPPLMFPPTIGKIMEPGSELLLQMHYGPAYQDELDQTSINIYFADVPLEREIETQLLTPADLLVPFYIPANEVVSFHGTRYVPSDVSVISTIPHSHLLGKSWLVYATSPDNQDTIPMISIPNWDFHWQGIFTYPSLLHIPGGYTVHAIAEYDNTSSNTFNPNNPPQDMWFGDLTTDEMYVMFFQFVDYLPGDESISINSLTENDIVMGDEKLLPAHPNPARSSDELTIGFTLASSAADVTLELFDINGRSVALWLDDVPYAPGRHLVRRFVPAGLPAGSYIYRLTTSNGAAVSKVLELVR